MILSNDMAAIEAMARNRNQPAEKRERWQKVRAAMAERERRAPATERRQPAPDPEVWTDPECQEAPGDSFA